MKGFDELDRLLAKVTDEMVDKSIGPALTAGGRQIIKKARDNLKRNGQYRTGNLSKSLDVKIVKSGNSKRAIIGARTGRSARYDGWYAHFIEYGVKPHAVYEGANLSSGRTKPDAKLHPGHSAKPFMRPAVDTSEQEVLEAMRMKLADTLRKKIK